MQPYLETARWKLLLTFVSCIASKVHILWTLLDEHTCMTVHSAKVAT